MASGRLIIAAASYLFLNDFDFKWSDLIAALKISVGAGFIIGGGQSLQVKEKKMKISFYWASKEENAAYPNLSTLVSPSTIDSWYNENDLCFSINFASSGEWLVSQICE